MTRGVRDAVVEERKREEGLEYEELEERDREEQRRDREKKIGKSLYNRWYGEIKVGDRVFEEKMYRGKMEESSKIQNGE